MVIKKILAIALVSALSSCSEVNENPTDCSEFITGEYTFSESSDVRILRTETYQKEFSMSDEGFIDEYGIEWTSSCAYKLWLINTSHPQDLDFKKGDTMYVQITATSPRGYAFKAATGDKIFERELYRIN
jgi:hypothetical protein